MNVKKPVGGTLALDVPYPYTIDDVKQEVSKKEGIPLRYLLLIFNGGVLEEGRRFSDYNLQDGSTIDLVIRQGG